MGVVADFYLCGGTTKEGLTYNDIISFSDEQLEQCHAHIQWIFPLTDPSSMITSAPVLTQGDVDILSGSGVFYGRYMAALEKMMSFYGFMVTPSDHGTHNYSWTNGKTQWITPKNHNFLRITRILKSLGIFGFHDVATEVFKSFKEIYDCYYCDIIGETSYNFWAEAINLNGVSKMVENLNKIGFYTMYDERVENVSSTSQMKRCEMIITEYCNFKCPYCRGLKAEIYGDRKFKMLSLDEIKRNIDLWCVNTPLENIRFSGGEPTLHPNILEIVSYAREKGIKRIAISTNGSSERELYGELVKAGANDFSISLDACCAEDGDKMAGDVKGSWDIVVSNIAYISTLTYVTVGVVLTPENIDRTIDTIRFAHGLGVADIRIISAAQYNKPIPRLNEVEVDILNAHPILAYRVKHFAEGRNVRGMSQTDYTHCALVLDDSVIAGDYHFPCVIYMREKGRAIGRVGEGMRDDRVEWFKNHNCYEDEICRNNCLDVCVDYNNRYRKLRVENKIVK